MRRSWTGYYVNSSDRHSRKARGNLQEPDGRVFPAQPQRRLARLERELQRLQAFDGTLREQCSVNPAPVLERRRSLNLRRRQARIGVANKLMVILAEELLAAKRCSRRSVHRVAEVRRVRNASTFVRSTEEEYGVNCA